MTFNDKLDYIYENIIHRNLTIREVAKELNMPKSTVHKYIHTYLKEELDRGDLDNNKYLYLCHVLDRHFNTKHINGGIATKAKWDKIKEQKYGCIK